MVRKRAFVTENDAKRDSWAVGVRKVRAITSVGQTAGSQGNQLLNALPPPVRNALLERMERVNMPVPRVLYRPRETPRYAHFLTAGVVSIVTLLQDGNGIDSGIIGPEGLVEALHLIGTASVSTEALMQVEGAALRIPFSELQREFVTCEPLRVLVLQHVQEQALMVNQLAACNHYHDVEARLARSLLMIEDRLGRSKFYLTQEFLAEMIGARRPTVTLAAGRLQRSGALRYVRGHIEIRDRLRLEHLACECYGVIRDLRLRR